MADYKKFYTIDGNLNDVIFSDVRVDGTSMNCVVVDGTIRFGKMPTISISAVSYSEASDEVEIELNAPSLNWDTGVWTVKADITDSTPTDTVGTMNANNTGLSLYYINNARATHGTGTKTVYVRLYYDGVYSGTVSASVTLTAPPDYYWDYITYYSSPPSYDVYVDNSSGSETNLDALENAYPANSQTLGDIGVVYDGTYYAEYEVKSN